MWATLYKFSSACARLSTHESLYPFRNRVVKNSSSIDRNAMSPSNGQTNTENITVRDDWNQIIEDSSEEHRQVTSISHGHWNVTQREASNKDAALYKTLNKII